MLLAHAFVQRLPMTTDGGSMSSPMTRCKHRIARWSATSVSWKRDQARGDHGRQLQSPPTTSSLGQDDNDKGLRHSIWCEVREEAERRAVVRVMPGSRGNVARAAEVLGISRPTLYVLMNRFGLRKKSQRDSRIHADALQDQTEPSAEHRRQRP